MRKISLLSLIAASLVHFQATAQMAEVVCYYQVVGGGRMLSAQDLIDLKYKHYIPVVSWMAGKKQSTFGGYGPDRFTEFTYTVQYVGVGQMSDPKINSDYLMNDLKKEFDNAGVVDPKVSYLGCKTTPLQQ